MGFKTAASTFAGVGEYLFGKYENVKYPLAFQIGQDHIETLFSIRAKGGFNNNPDVAMFKSALRSLLVKTDITPSPSANCLELDDTNQGTLGSVVLSSRK